MHPLDSIVKANTLSDVAVHTFRLARWTGALSPLDAAEHNKRLNHKTRRVLNALREFRRRLLAGERIDVDLTRLDSFDTAAAAYSKLPLFNQRVLIGGAGPAGLYTAALAGMLGADVTVIERRSSFARRNLLRLWGGTVAELRDLGVRILAPSMAVGGVDHVGINELQLALLKVAVLSGVRSVLTGAIVNELDFPIHFFMSPTSLADRRHSRDVGDAGSDSKSNNDETNGTVEGGGLRVNIGRTPASDASSSCGSFTASELSWDDGALEENGNGDGDGEGKGKGGVADGQFCGDWNSDGDDAGEHDGTGDDGDVDLDVVREFDFVVGCDGPNSAIREAAGIETMAVHVQKRSIGLVCTFKHGRTKRDEAIKEFDGSRHRHFGERLEKLAAERNVSLENIGYFRNRQVHYLVATIDLQSLVDRGVVTDGAATLDPQHVNADELDKVAVDIASFFDIPCDEMVGRAAAFDYSTVRKAKRIWKAGIDGTTHVLLAGDAARGSFWPLGTGANMAVQSGRDVLYMMVQLSNSTLSGRQQQRQQQKEAEPEPEPEKELHSLDDLAAIHDITLRKQHEVVLSNSLSPHERWRLDPQTRYASHVMF